MRSAILVDNYPVVHHQRMVDKLLQLMQQRLMLQHDVARWKWNQKSPIEAPKREQELLAKLQQQAIASGLDPNATLAFFQRQIQAGKLIQTVDFQNWQRMGVEFFANVPSLSQTLRPLLDRLDVKILSVLATVAPVLDCPTLQEQELLRSRAEIILRGDGIDDTVRHVVLEAK